MQRATRKPQTMFNCLWFFVFYMFYMILLKQRQGRRYGIIRNAPVAYFYIVKEKLQ